MSVYNKQLSSGIKNWADKLGIIEEASKGLAGGNRRGGNAHHPV